MGTLLNFPPLLAIGEYKKSGLILCQNHRAEFAGPGAAIGTLVERGYKTVIAIGSPDFVEVVTPEERQKAYGRRIQWMRWLQKIAEVQDAVERVEKLFYGLEAFFGGCILRRIPNEVLALMIGTLPQTVAEVRSRHRTFGLDNHELDAIGSEASVLIVDSRTPQTALPIASSCLVETLHRSHQPSTKY